MAAVRRAALSSGWRVRDLGVWAVVDVVRVVRRVRGRRRKFVRIVIVERWVGFVGKVCRRIGEEARVWEKG